MYKRRESRSIQSPTSNRCRHWCRKLFLSLFVGAIGIIVAGKASPAKPPPIPDGVDFQVLPAKIGPKIVSNGLGSLRYRGGVMFQSREMEFGRFSGIHVDTLKSRLYAVGGDTWISGDLIFDDDGFIDSFRLTHRTRLKDPRGSILSDPKDADAEALFFDGSRYYVGFEGHNRIWSYEHPADVATEYPLPRELLANVPDWGGFSSISGRPSGLLMTLTEGGRDDEQRTKGWLFDGEGGRRSVATCGPRLAPGGHRLRAKRRSLSCGNQATQQLVWQENALCSKSNFGYRRCRHCGRSNSDAKTTWSFETSRLLREDRSHPRRSRC